MDWYYVYGVDQSFFTRKLTAYLDYKDLPWRYHRFIDGPVAPELNAAGWEGGIPALRCPDGTLIWDSTAVLLHLESVHAQRSILPDDPTWNFLSFLIDDYMDEWMYRPAVGSRWLYEENTSHGSWDLGRDLAISFGIFRENGGSDQSFTGDQVRAMAKSAMQTSIHKLGAVPENIDSLMEESFKPWQAAVSNHFGAHGGYFFGARPSLADFAVFGANAAHFVNDPLVRRWTDEVGPEATRHFNRLVQPWDVEFGDWLEPGDAPDTLITVLREIGKIYLPWVAEATDKGAALVRFDSGVETEIATTDFLTHARGVMLARYVAARSASVDAVLEEAGILKWFAGYTDQATVIPDFAVPPQPVHNRAYPATP